MKIKFSKKFVKQYSKLQVKQKNKVNEVINLFEINPFGKRLDNHALRGKMNNKRSIYAGGDLRLIFEEYDKYAMVLFIKVGSHNQVY